MGYWLVQRKEYPIRDFGPGDVLEVVDSEGNPFIPSEATNYRIVGEDGSTLKEGTLQDTNIIPLTGIETRRFRVLLESYVVTETKGFEAPQEEEIQMEEPDMVIPEGPGQDWKQDLFDFTEKPEGERESEPEEQEEGEEAEASEVEETEAETPEEEEGETEPEEESSNEEQDEAVEEDVSEHSDSEG